MNQRRNKKGILIILFSLLICVPITFTIATISTMNLTNEVETNDNKTTIEVEKKSIQLEPILYVDIKPGSWPNPINLKSKGVFPVAVCGTEKFDVTTINPSSIKITIEGLEGCVSALRWSYEDVATPYIGEKGDGHELEADGFLDLVLHFDTQEVVDTLKLRYHIGEIISLAINGNLKEELEELLIIGEDFVKILKDKKLLTPFIIDDDGVGGDYTWKEASKQPWCKGAGTIKKPYIIENIAINGAGTTECLVIRNSNAYFIVRDCRFYNSEVIEGVESAALVVENAANGKIINNDFYNNTHTSIGIRNSNSTEILNNTCSNSTYGIVIAGWISGAFNNSIEGNTCTNNSHSGILLWNQVFYNTVNENICSENIYGITLAANANYTEITDNICSQNNIGIFFSDGSGNNTITGNLFEKNYYGVYFHWEGGLEHCFNNYIDYNDFISNNDAWGGLPDMDWYYNNIFGTNNYIGT